MCSRRASVLYQELLRNLLLWIAAEGDLDPFWTERILDETRRNLIGDGVLERKQWERLRMAMLASFPDAMLDQAAADAIEDEMPNDEKDRHVLAGLGHGDALAPRFVKAATAKFEVDATPPPPPRSSPKDS